MVERDVDQLAHSIAATLKEQTKAILAKRGAELALKINQLHKRMEEDVDDLVDRMAQLNKDYTAPHLLQQAH